ncbi:hypothetical protein GGS23DRAFT_549213 [Durotheca rogersii]|uniref:uncharacterized protein n=1 Tax=Durotheca rogersii TaxID=419775 RepID=UPI002220BD1C|nr:uncharacterized protein GGS23DRAFT_549213 [Durotheca rogersii]KAI5867621.1 hypothetical protein GGS23DRAFT_549213 [Durotheca rogersii]
MDGYAHKRIGTHICMSPIRPPACLCLRGFRSSLLLPPSPFPLPAGFSRPPGTRPDLAGGEDSSLPDQSSERPTTRRPNLSVCLHAPVSSTIPPLPPPPLDWVDERNGEERKRRGSREREREGEREAFETLFSQRDVCWPDPASPGARKGGGGREPVFPIESRRPVAVFFSSVSSCGSLPNPGTLVRHGDWGWIWPRRCGFGMYVYVCRGCRGE